MNEIEAYILQLINEAPSAEALIASIKDDPRDGAGYGLGPKTAEAVLALRDEKDGFRSIQELLEVPGFGENKLNDFIHSFEGKPDSEPTPEDNTGPVKSPPRPTDEEKHDLPPDEPLVVVRDVLLKCKHPGQSLAGFRLFLRPMAGTPAPFLDNYRISETGDVRLQLPASATPLQYKAYLVNNSGILKFSYPLTFPPGGE